MLPTVTRRFRRHLGAHFVAYVALFVALGGSAGAAVIVSSNSQVGPDVIAGSKAPTGKTNNIIAGSLGAADLAAGAIGNGRLADNAVTSAKIADGQIGTADLGTGAVTSSKLAPGSVGSNAIATGAVGARQLGSDVQQSIDFNLTPGAGTPLARDGVQIGDVVFSAICGAYPGTPVFSLGITAKTANTFSISWVHGPAGGPLQTSMHTQSSLAQSGPLVDLGANEQGQATFVLNATGEALTGTLHYLADATHCEVTGQLNRAVN